jgi:response regulator NasT
MNQILRTVAFVDDEAGILQILKMACETRYEIVGQGKNGLEAITLVKALKPQILVLDMHMPVMDGLEALRQIVPLRTTAVVVLSADQDAAIVRQAMEAGACGYFNKPFDYSQVIPMLETAWHHFQSAKVLGDQLLEMTESLETRKLLERAKGILIEQQGFTEDQAHKVLQKMSQDQAISLKEVCRSLIQVKNLLGRAAQRKAV